MVDFSTMLTNRSIIKPSFALMQQAYEDYRADPAPCKGGFENQCAVRMSVALLRCGFSLDAFQPQNHVHRNRRPCRLTVPHVLRAAELGNYLMQIWGAPELYRGATLGDARRRTQYRAGVIYFNDCFSREENGPRVGDHIDLFTGKAYYNQILRLGAGGDAGSETSLFDRANEVWFFPLPG
jgi:hypothetical protein